MQEITITQATTADLPIVQEIARNTFAETFSVYNTEENMKKYLAESFSDERYMPNSATPAHCFTSPRKIITLSVI
jgi:hypothetical protein